MIVTLSRHTYPAPAAGTLYCSIPGCAGAPTYTTWVGAAWLVETFTIALCADHAAWARRDVEDPRVRASTDTRPYRAADHP